MAEVVVVLANKSNAPWLQRKLTVRVIYIRIIDNTYSIAFILSKQIS